MANRLEEARNEIDILDKELAELFEKRFHLVRDIIDYKVENRLPILDEGREKEIIEKNTNRIKDLDLQKHFRKVYTYMIEVSRDYQEEVLNDK